MTPSTQAHASVNLVWVVSALGITQIIAWGSLMGRLAQPAFLAKAVAPVSLALLVGQGVAYETLPLILVALASLAMLAFVLALRSAHRTERLRDEHRFR